VIAPGSPVPEPDVYDAKGAAPLPVFYDGTALLVFFRAVSEPCADLLREIQELRTLEPHVPVVGVSQETIEDTAKLLYHLDVRFPVVIDDRPCLASRAFGVKVVPAFVLVHDDQVVGAVEGLVPELARLLDSAAALASRPGEFERLSGLTGSSPSRSFEP